MAFSTSVVPPGLMNTPGQFLMPTPVIKPPKSLLIRRLNRCLRTGYEFPHCPDCRSILLLFSFVVGDVLTEVTDVEFCLEHVLKRRFTSTMRVGLVTRIIFESVGRLIRREVWAVSAEPLAIVPAMRHPLRSLRTPEPQDLIVCPWSGPHIAAVPM